MAEGQAKRRPPGFTEAGLDRVQVAEAFKSETVSDLTIDATALALAAPDQSCLKPLGGSA
jgi:hypothetical protein